MLYHTRRQSPMRRNKITVTVTDCWLFSESAIGYTYFELMHSLFYIFFQVLVGVIAW